MLPAVPSVNRVPSAGGADGSCFPDSRPPAIGVYGITPQPSSAEGPGQLVGKEVRATDVPHLARVHQVVQCTQRLVDGRSRIWTMELVEVDVVGPQPPQRCLDGGQNMLPRIALIPGVRAPAPV